MIDHRLHSLTCSWPQGDPCLDFSTDGTEAGALIAHAFGTQDLSAILTDPERRKSLIELNGVWHLNTGSRLPNQNRLTGVEEEQSDWDSRNTQEPCETCAGYGCAECEPARGAPHDPENCPNGGDCQDDDCIDYWQRKAERLYGDSEPWRD